MTLADGMVYIVKNFENAVVPISTATAVGSQIPVGTDPDAVAITPDQAPVASFTAAGGGAGSSTMLGPSASTSATSPIASFGWNFGNGRRRPPVWLVTGWTRCSGARRDRRGGHVIP